MGGSIAGLKGYWKFNENTGRTTADASGSGDYYTGTMTSGAEWRRRQTGAAVSLDRSDDDVQWALNRLFAMTSAASFTAWIYSYGCRVKLPVDAPLKVE